MTSTPKPKQTSASLLQMLWTKSTFWMVNDALLINLALALAYVIRYELQWLRAVDPANDVPLTAFTPFTILLTLLLLFVYRYEGVYQSKRRRSWLDEMYLVFNGTTTGIVLMIVLVFLYRPIFYSRIIFLYTGVLILVLVGLSRLLKIGMLDHWRRQGFNVRWLLIVGAGEQARTVMRAVVANPSLGYRIIGFVDDDEAKGSTDIGRFEALGSLQNLSQILREREVDEVIITLPWQYQRKILNIITQCERLNVRARVMPGIFQMALGHMEIVEMAGIPLLGFRSTSMRGANLILKRVFDFTLALLALIVASPLMALVALAIKLDSPGPVIFRQDRIGRNEKPFGLYKFRSMVQDADLKKEDLNALNEADGPLFKIKDDPRRTRIGRFIRKFSLDELPQFYNVLKGDLSLVGPRPNLPDEVANYKDWHKRRLELMPGMTGLWVIYGRSELTFDEMVLLDIYYLENWSFALDVKILLQTIPRVIMGRGAY